MYSFGKSLFIEVIIAKRIDWRGSTSGTRDLSVYKHVSTPWKIVKTDFTRRIINL